MYVQIRPHIQCFGHGAHIAPANQTQLSTSMRYARDWYWNSRSEFVHGESPDIGASGWIILTIHNHTRRICIRDCHEGPHVPLFKPSYSTSV